MTAATLIVMPLALVFEMPWTARLSGATWLALGTLSIFSTADTHIICFQVLSSAGAPNLLLVTSLIPITKIVLAAPALGEEITSNAISKLLLIFFGLGMIDGRLSKLFRGFAGASLARPVCPDLPPKRILTAACRLFAMLYAALTDSPKQCLWV